jgi:hypothetical protein
MGASSETGTQENNQLYSSHFIKPLKTSFIYNKLVAALLTPLIALVLAYCQFNISPKRSITVPVFSEVFVVTSSPNIIIINANKREH